MTTERRLVAELCYEERKPVKDAKNIQRNNQSSNCLKEKGEII
jgi:hypothetical protein